MRDAARRDDGLCFSMQQKPRREFCVSEEVGTHHGAPDDRPSSISSSLENALALTSAFRFSGACSGCWLLGKQERRIRQLGSWLQAVGFWEKRSGRLPRLSQQPNSQQPAASPGTPSAHSRSVRLIPWWLSGREERCGACGHGYAHRGGARCVTCDREVCLNCVESTDSELRCLPCEPGSRKATKRRVPWRPARSGKV